MNFRKTVVLGAAIAFTAMSSAHADERLFTFSYEADTLPQGKFEYESWLTHKFGTEEGSLSKWEQRQEIEYGITDRLTTGFYLNTAQESYKGVPGKTDGTEFEFSGVSSEWKYQVLNPYLSPVGVLAYFEAGYSGLESALEEKIILQHNAGEKVTLVSNIIFEQEYEYEGRKIEDEGKFELSLGGSYKLTPNWSLGLEALNVSKYEASDYRTWERGYTYAGPNVHYGNSKWWLTGTFMTLVQSDNGQNSEIDLVNNEQYRLRVIFGYLF
ncbi:MAG: hypothetical protein O3A01_07020 [bacterium]|nr:hypothetical protein [bacterium]